MLQLYAFKDKNNIKQSCVACWHIMPQVTKFSSGEAFVDTVDIKLKKDIIPTRC